MDAVRVSALRESLAGTGWIEATRTFAGALRGSVTRPGAAGLLLVGTAQAEPWHLAAHLDDEAAWCGVPELSPTLLRHRVPVGAPAHLGHDLRRLERARRGETVLVVAATRAGEPLLERVHGARHAGATVLAMEAGDEELRGLAHEVLTVDLPTPDQVRTVSPADLAGAVAGAAEEPESAFDLIQHLVSASAGQARLRRGMRDRLALLAERWAAPAAVRW